MNIKRTPEEIENLRQTIGPEKCTCGKLKCLVYMFGLDILEWLEGKDNAIQQALSLVKKSEEKETNLSNN